MSAQSALSDLILYNNRSINLKIFGCSQGLYLKLLIARYEKR